MKDPDAMLVGARGSAIKAADAKAQDYARLAGFRSAELVAIGEGSFAGPQPPMPRVQMMAAEAKATPVEPGQVGNTLTPNFQYRLVRSHPIVPFVSSPSPALAGAQDKLQAGPDVQNPRTRARPDGHID